MLQQEERKNMIEVVREIISGVSDDEAGYILWNHTCFPFGMQEQVKEQIEQFRAEREQAIAKAKGEG